MNFGLHIGYSYVVSFYHKEIHRSDMSSAARKGRQFHTGGCAKLMEVNVLSKMSYAYYQANVKPKDLGKSADADKKIVAWRCTVCGFVYNDPVLPDDYLCPVCGQPSSDFVPVYE